MQTTRRDIFRGALATGLMGTLPSIAATRSTMAPALKARYAKLDAAASQPVFKRELFTEPAIIESVDLLHYKNSWICRVRTKDGHEGISVSNSQQMEMLYPSWSSGWPRSLSGRMLAILKTSSRRSPSINRTTRLRSGDLGAHGDHRVRHSRHVRQDGRTGRSVFLSPTRSTTRRSTSIRPTVSAYISAEEMIEHLNAMLPSPRRRLSSSSWAAACRIPRPRRPQRKADSAGPQDLRRQDGHLRRRQRLLYSGAGNSHRTADAGVQLCVLRRAGAV